MQPQFIVCTDMTGEPVIINVAHIVAVDEEDRSKPCEHPHQEFDPDCRCPDCGNPCEASHWWSRSIVVLDIADEETIPTSPTDDTPVVYASRQQRCVRETVVEIARLLGAEAASKPVPCHVEHICGDPTCVDQAHLRVVDD